MLRSCKYLLTATRSVKLYMLSLCHYAHIHNHRSAGHNTNEPLAEPSLNQDKSLTPISSSRDETFCDRRQYLRLHGCDSRCFRDNDVICHWQRDSRRHSTTSCNSWLERIEVVAQTIEFLYCQTFVRKRRWNVSTTSSNAIMTDSMSPPAYKYCLSKHPINSLFICTETAALLIQLIRI